jgi:predicted 2-oxoglutarate/Fe(II)-dependent dioxygenase YbiX
MLEDLPCELQRHWAVPLRAPPAGLMVSMYQNGAAYTAHRDGVVRSERGLWPAARAVACALRGPPVSARRALTQLAVSTSDVRFRELTAILYLNPVSWSEKDGGALRIFGGCKENDPDGRTATSVTDVLPLGGTLVVFDSSSVLHAVLPSSRQRFAATVWLENGWDFLGKETAASLEQDQNF